METLEATQGEKEISATLSLLTMVIKSVPEPVLRKKFAESGEMFLQLLEQFAESDNQNALRSVSNQNNPSIKRFSKKNFFFFKFFF